MTQISVDGSPKPINPSMVQSIMDSNDISYVNWQRNNAGQLSFVTQRNDAEYAVELLSYNLEEYTKDNSYKFVVSHKVHTQEGSAATLKPPHHTVINPSISVSSARNMIRCHSQVTKRTKTFP